MNATTNFTVKSLRANKVRTLVTIAGVALAAALLTAVLTTYVSLNDYLYRSEAHLAGTWMACVEADGSSALDEKIADAQADPQVAGTAIMRDVGFAKLTADQQNTQGTYLAIRSIEGDVGDICGIAPSEGRLPENDHEIMLFSTWNDYGGVNLGDTVTFDVGQRVARLAPGEEGSMSAGTMTASWGVQGEAHESEITDGTPLNSSMGVLEADIDGGIFNEDITNTEESTYTVVGFYDRPGYALSTAAGMVGVTAGGAAPDAFTDVFFTLNDVANTQQVEEAAEALFPDEHVVLHTAMLRYMGVSSDSSIWATFYGLVVVLAAVIVLSAPLGCLRSVNAQRAQVLELFAQGGQGDGGSVASDLQDRIGTAQNLLTVARRYPETDGISDLEGAIAWAQGNADPDKGAFPEADVNMGAVCAQVIAQLRAAGVSEKDAQYLYGFEAELSGAADRMSRDEYSKAADRFNRKVLGRFPAVLLRNLGAVKELALVADVND